MDWREKFVGRDVDLEVLKTAYEEARMGSPRVVAVVAESGFGKTRLAQEFYNWLSATHDGPGYWSDRLARKADNLLVNPDLVSCGGEDKRMPFLWWGLRVGDPGERNGTASCGALRGHLKELRAHLELYQREFRREELTQQQLTGRAKAAGDIALGVVDGLSFGILGFVKSAIEGYADHTGSKREIARLDALDMRPSAVEDRARDTLAETIIGDLHCLCKAPPKGFESIPLVLFIDDVQWLETDGGMSSFLNLLLARARAEKWPILVLLTSWRREWRATAAEGRMPGLLVREDLGDLVHALGAIDGLATIIRAAFQGLTDAQVAALAEKADGNARLLNAMLHHLSRRAGYFVQKDLRQPLTEKGLTEILKGNFASFVAERLQESPDHVRRALAIASMQGIGFSPRLVRRVAEGLRLVDTEAGLREGEDPHSFVAGVHGIAGGEFRQRAYHEAAREDLENFFDAPDVETELAAALREVARDPASATDKELVVVLDGALARAPDQLEWTGWAIDVGAELIRRAQDISDARSAAETADKILPFFREAAGIGRTMPLLTAWHAVRIWSGFTQQLLDIVATIVGAQRDLVAVQDTPDARQGLAFALIGLGHALDDSENYADARTFFDEGAALLLELAHEKRTSRGWEELLHALVPLGQAVKILEGHASARPHFEECARIARTLAEKHPTLERRRFLAMALHHLGSVVQESDGLDAARVLLEEAVQIMRDIASGQPTASARRDLAQSLAGLGLLVKTTEGEASARLQLEEEVEIMRAVVAEQPIPAYRHDLVMAISRLGELVRDLDGPVAARAYLEEAEQLARALAAEHPSLHALRSLCYTLGQLGGIMCALEDPNAALALYEEEAECANALVEANPGSRQDIRSYAMAISNQAKAVATLEGHEPAQLFRQNAVKIFRSLLREDPSPRAERDLAMALMKLADSVEALDGSVAARPLRTEATNLLKSILQRRFSRKALLDLCMAMDSLIDTVKSAGDDEAATDLQEALDGVLNHFSQ